MGAVRLSPPITILAIVGVALGWLSLTWRNDDCYFTPDGKQRFSSFVDAAVSRFKSGPDCDVWIGIKPRKSIETIELRQDANDGASIIARISPNGSGFVAVVPPYLSSEHPLNGTMLPSRELYQKYAKVFDFVRSDAQTYQSIRMLIGPLRDFQGGFALEMENPESRKFFELDDPLTTVIKCRKERGVIPASHGPVIGFSFKGRAEPMMVTTGLGCVDAAQRAATTRVNRSLAMLFEATGQRAAIHIEAKKNYPICTGPFGMEACYLPIL